MSIFALIGTLALSSPTEMTPLVLDKPAITDSVWEI
jgi:hypothetical protein